MNTFFGPQRPIDYSLALAGQLLPAMAMRQPAAIVDVLNQFGVPSGYRAEVVRDVGIATSLNAIANPQLSLFSDPSDLEALVSRLPTIAAPLLPASAQEVIEKGEALMRKMEVSLDACRTKATKMYVHVSSYVVIALNKESREAQPLLGLDREFRGHYIVHLLRDALVSTLAFHRLGATEIAQKSFDALKMFIQALNQNGAAGFVYANAIARAHLSSVGETRKSIEILQLVAASTLQTFADVRVLPPAQRVEALIPIDAFTRACPKDMPPSASIPSFTTDSLRAGTALANHEYWNVGHAVSSLNGHSRWSSFFKRIGSTLPAGTTYVLGGNHGQYLHEIRRRVPKTDSVVMVDSTGMAGFRVQQFISDFGAIYNLPPTTFRQEDVVTTTFDQPANLVLAINLLEYLRPEERVHVLRNAFSALAEKGVVYICSHLQEGRRYQNLAALPETTRTPTPGFLVIQEELQPGVKCMLRKQFFTEEELLAEVRAAFPEGRQFEVETSRLSEGPDDFVGLQIIVRRLS